MSQARSAEARHQAHKLSGTSQGPKKRNARRAGSLDPGRGHAVAKARIHYVLPYKDMCNVEPDADADAMPSLKMKRLHHRERRHHAHYRPRMLSKP
ncbi:hypothetical protein PsYK624_044060 [Phanerochaete sordida]|uniref:Uncharacterized protein n=1 Tax=Phanerochaete sordida TaxID=48140 RepID=A0A9P3G3B8_9APHY|nr:hypothetical protein PsYK624_044060 [Phanerochaete sordida]